MAYKATRQSFGETVARIAEKNLQVVVMDADLGKSTMTGEFAKKFPERYFELGIAEKNLIGTAAGMALSGKIPNNGKTGLEVLRAQLLYDFGARSGLVGQALSADLRFKLLNDGCGKTVRVGWKRRAHDQSHHFPVARRGVLAPGALHHSAVGACESIVRFGIVLFPGAAKRCKPAEAEAFQIGERDAAHMLCGMLQSIATLVSILCGIGKLPYAHGVHHD